MNSDLIPFDGLAINRQDCAAICRLFGIIDPEEFRQFASNQQRKHEDRQLNSSKAWKR